jgi:phage tail-like protein
MLQFGKDPLSAFRFSVTVDGEDVGAFTQFSGIKMQVQTIQARSGSDIRGVQEYVPVLTTYAPVTLTRGVITNDSFVRWLFTASASNHIGPAGGRNLRRTLDVFSLEEDGKAGMKWSLIDAMPIAYEVTPMDSSRSEVLFESMTFAIMGVDRSTGTSRGSEHWG